MGASAQLFPGYGFGAAPADFPPELGDPTKSLFRNHGVPYKVTLTGSQVLNDQSVVPFTDADFFWLALAGISDGNFSMNFKYPDGSWYSSSQLQKANILGTIAEPFLLWPAVLIPKGQMIGFQFTELSTSTNNVELHLIGMKRIVLAP